MGEWIGRGRKARRAYGFDEISLVPGEVTINPEEVDVAWELDGKKYPIPIIASAMDGVVDVRFAVEMSRLGAIATLNSEGIQTRYDHPEEVLDKISIAVEKNPTVEPALMEFKNYICTETQAVSLELKEKLQDGTEVDMDAFMLKVTISLTR